MSYLERFGNFYFAYSQFMVSDNEADIPCNWTEIHISQGFLRNESAVCFGALAQFGHATVTIFNGSYIPNRNYKRVIAVPLRVNSGIVIVSSPDDSETIRPILMGNGNYRLVSAQYGTGTAEEIEEDLAEVFIDLFLEEKQLPLTRSEILVADEALNPPALLLESAEIAGAD